MGRWYDPTGSASQGVVESAPECAAMPNGEETDAKKNKKRTGYFKVREIELTKKVGLEVRAYDMKGKFVGRLEINRAGLEAFVGRKGQKSIGDLSWEKVFARLAKKEEK